MSGQVVNFAYTAFDLPTHVWGNTTEQWFYYSGPGVMDSSRTRTASSPVTRYATDSKGRVYQVTDPGGHAITTTFEPNGKQNTSGSIAPGNRTTTIRRDDAGHVIAVVSPAGTVDTMRYDGLNRQRFMRKGGTQASFDYDSLFLTTITDARGQQYTFLPNALGWAEQEVRPGSSLAILRRYDSTGNTVGVTDRRGRVVTYDYDGLNRVRSYTAVTEGQTTSYGYGLVAGGGSFESTTNGESTDTTYVDRSGRVSQSATWRSTGAYYVTNGFFTDGNRSSMAATGSTGVSYTYDANQDLLTFTNFAGTTTFGRNSEGLPEHVYFPNGLEISQAFTSLHRSKGPLYWSPSGPSAVDVNARLGVRVATDAMGRVGERRRSLNDSLKTYTYSSDGSLNIRSFWSDGPSPTCTDDPNYGYRCTGATRLSNEWYGFDWTGNPSNPSSVIGPGNQVSRIYSPSNGAWYNFTYDADGNVDGKTGPGLSQSFVWNSIGQLTSVTTNGVTVDFGYDGFGRRVRKSVQGGAVVRYLYDGHDLLRELDGAGAVVAEYSYLPGIDQPHSVKRNGVIYYFTRDEVGASVNGLVRASDNAVVAQYGYTPFGQLETGSFDQVGNPIRYASREYDGETDLYYFRARYYDPDVLRFLSEDPIGLDGGLNLYRYADNDPINNSDPTGLRTCTKFSDGREVCVSDAVLDPITVTGRYTPFSWPADPMSLFPPGGPAWGRQGTTNPAAKKYKAVSCPAFLARGSNFRTTLFSMGSTKNGANEMGAYFSNGAGGTLVRGPVTAGTAGAVTMPYPPAGTIAGGHLHPGPYNTAQWGGQGPTIGDAAAARANGFPEFIVSQDSIFWINPSGAAYGCAK